MVVIIKNISAVMIINQIFHRITVEFSRQFFRNVVSGLDKQYIGLLFYKGCYIIQRLYVAGYNNGFSLTAYPVRKTSPYAVLRNSEMQIVKSLNFEVFTLKACSVGTLFDLKIALSEIPVTTFHAESKRRSRIP